MAIDRRTGSPDRLVHVGPHKTGTTTVQAAFHSNRAALREAGVLYLGDQLQPTGAVKALTGAARGDVQERGLEQWEELVAEADASGGTVVLSSEFLCEADVPVAQRVVEELGRTARHRPHVVVTLRPLAKILPSQWQQFVQSGTETPLLEWLEGALDSYDSDPPPLVWRRHRHHDVVSRWVQAAGADNVTVVAADETRPDFLPRVFEELLGLPEGVLVPPVPIANRSLTLEEAEAVRLVNASFKQLRSRSRPGARTPVVPDLTMDQRMATWRSLKRTTPDPAYHKVALPVATVERVEALARDAVEAIQALQVHVIGDLEALTAVGATLSEDALRVDSVRPQLVADVATALLGQTMSPTGGREDGGHPRAAQVATPAATGGRLRALARGARRLSRSAVDLGR